MEAAQEIEILNVVGDLVASQSTELFRGANIVDIDFSKLVPGVYFVRIQNDSNAIVKKVVKQ